MGRNETNPIFARSKRSYFRRSASQFLPGEGRPSLRDKAFERRYRPDRPAIAKTLAGNRGGWCWPPGNRNTSAVTRGHSRTEKPIHVEFNEKPGRQVAGCHCRAGADRNEGRAGAGRGHRWIDACRGVGAKSRKAPGLARQTDARAPAVLPIEQLSDAADIVIECAPGKLLRSIVAPFVESGKTAVVLSAGALLDNEDLIAACQTKWRSDRGAHGGADRPRRGDGRGGRNHPFGQDGDPQAGSGARRRSLYRRKQYRHRTHYRAAPDIRGDGAGGGQGIPGQSECRRRAVAGRHRPRPNHGWKSGPIRR